MKNQIIKKPVEFFEEFVQENFIRENDYFIFNSIIFRKLVYEKKINDFLLKLKPYYFLNKHYYLEREPLLLNHFNTILRQICKNNDIKITHKVKYEQSKYTIEYYIYL